MNTQFKAIAAIITACILWGISFVSIKVVVPILGPIGLAFYRFVISTVVVLIMIQVGKGSIQIQTKDIPKFILTGFLGIVAYFYFQNTGIDLITASESSIVIASIPVFTLLAESIMTRTKISRIKALMVCLSFVGVYIMIGFSSKDSQSQSNLLGYAMMFGAVFSWVFYGLTSKPLSETYSQLTIVFYQGLFGAIMLGGLTFLEPQSSFEFSSTVIINLLYLAVFCSGITYYLYNYALKNMGVSTTNLYLNLIPIVTVVTSSVLLKEQITLYQIIGGILILLSVFAVSWNRPKKSEDAVQNEYYEESAC